MRIYIDFDDVLCETARHLATLTHELFQKQVPYEAITGFDLREAFQLSEQEIDALMAQAHETDFLAALAPAPGGLEAVRELDAQGHKLEIVTGRPASSHAGSLAWLARYGLEHLSLIHVDKYGRAPAQLPVGTPRTLTVQEFAALSFDVAIDDSPIALDLLAPRRECLIIIYDRPWNQHYSLGVNMRRTGSWHEIVKLIGAHS